LLETDGIYPLAFVKGNQYFLLSSFNGGGGAEFINMSEFASHKIVHILLPIVSLYLLSLEALPVCGCVSVCVSLHCLYVCSIL